MGAATKRSWSAILAALALALVLTPIRGLADNNVISDMPTYPGATPKPLCYWIDPALGPFWKDWIEQAVANWNAAKAGWTFRPCTEAEANLPDIVFAVSDLKNAHGDPVQLPGGAQGGARGGGAGLGYWHISIEPNVNGMTINNVAVKGGLNGNGWRMGNDPGETTLDPVLVMEHELTHAMGLDGDLGGCDTGNVENPICPGNHANPTGRKPSAKDVTDVQAALTAYKALIAANAAKAQKTADGSAQAPGPQTTPAETPKSESPGAETPAKPTEPQGGSQPPPPGKGSTHDTSFERQPTDLETAVLREINEARTDPKGYARHLQSDFSPAATADAVAFLERQPPVPALVWDARIAQAAVKHAEDQGPLGQDSHTGSDGSRPMARMYAMKVVAMLYAEEISVGEPSAARDVGQLIVDISSPQHPHRTDLFDSLLKFAGVGCGPNARFMTMCVVDLAGAPPPP